MTEVSPIRLWAMRAMYLVMAAGLGLTIWPPIVSHGDTVPRMTGVAWSLLGTIGLPALVGLRYPPQFQAEEGRSRQGRPGSLIMA